MRILHLVHQFPPEHIGGTEFYTQWLVKAQQARGHETAVFHRRSGEGNGLEKQEVDGVSVFSAWDGRMTPTSRFRATFGNTALSQRFAQALDQFKPQFVHVQHLMGLPAELTQQLQARQIPYVVTLHDYFYFCANAQLITNYDQTLCEGPKVWVNCARCTISRAGYPNALLAVPPLVPLLGWRNGQLKRVLNGATAVIAPSDFVRDVYAEHGVDSTKIKVIQHGIVPPDQAAQRLIENKRPFQAPPLNVVYIGGIAPQKGIDVLITAVNQLPPHQISCTIYGDLSAFPDYVAHLQKMIANSNITLAGKMSRDALWQRLLTADCLVVPALWHETSSLVINEAFAAKVPVLASKLGGMSEKIVDGKNGRYLIPGDATDLAQKLQQLINNPHLLNEMAQNMPPIRTIQQHSEEIMALYHT